MYGVVGQQACGPKCQERLRDQRESNQRQRKKNDTITSRILNCVKKRFDGNEKQEDLDELVMHAGRHRPEELAKLAAITKFTKKEIKLIYRGFKQECPSGVVDEDCFKHIFAQFFPQGDATKYAHYVFNTIKRTQGSKINFEEFLSILSRVSRGSRQDKLQWVFALYDVDGDGRISKAEMTEVVGSIYEMLGRATAPTVQDTSARDHVDRIFHLIDTDQDGCVSLDELSSWCSRDARIMQSFDTLDTIL